MIESLTIRSFPAGTRRKRRFARRKMRRPRKVNEELTKRLEQLKLSIILRAPEYVHQIRKLKCYVTNTNRGFAYISLGFLSVPARTFRDSNPHYAEHYLAHELSHFLCGERGHTRKFYKIVMETSPAPELELNYRARNARSAGIYEGMSKKSST